MCGESYKAQRDPKPPAGPSPRVRGIRLNAGEGVGGGGSIPACAGNPVAVCLLHLHGEVHPRVCGESPNRPQSAVCGRGPSPRVRGIQAPGKRPTVKQGSIPACAGNPYGAPVYLACSRVHPRVCGESASWSYQGVTHEGPSPRVRGIRGHGGARDLAPGSIPACAGNPRRDRGVGAVIRVHPRVCGESRGRSAGPHAMGGPSPRVRGIPVLRLQKDVMAGSIPACAGNPGLRALCGRHPGVHPRVCGESLLVVERAQPGAGPSPRVRGIPNAHWPESGPQGSIPACAGNPPITLATVGRSRVHPRVCGESEPGSEVRQPEQGPSPRVRGIHAPGAPAYLPLGSIPACAGNPAHPQLQSEAKRVHPRVCGESHPMHREPSPGEGPSPRVRGIPGCDGERGRGVGSIPACAGNPAPTPRTLRSPGVHPRVCGESSRPSPGRPSRRGPSPRVRGIHVRRERDQVASGSIPACAGNPSPRMPASTAIWVHPRVCGESPVESGDRVYMSGPSPRVRGILLRTVPCLTHLGSIPACAGNPSTGRARGRTWRVHPRVCGESALPDAVDDLARGPSPRVRGILPADRRRSTSARSIPACAGNPLRTPRRPGGFWVHPRVCGESCRMEQCDYCVAGPSPRVRGIPSAAEYHRTPYGSIPACAGNPAVRYRYPIQCKVHPRVCGESVELPNAIS